MAQALAELIGSDDGRPLLHERLSLHARLLLSEAVITLHTAPPKSRAPPASGGVASAAGALVGDAAAGPPPPSTLQVSLTNVGVHAGLEPGRQLADVYWQAIRVDAVGGRGVPLVPLVAPLPASARERRRSSAPVHIQLEVDTTAAFRAVGLAELLPALCERADSAHKASMWQLGLRWHTEQRPSSAAVAPMADTTERTSEVAVRWRSSQQLAILCNHPAFAAAANLVSAITQRCAASLSSFC